MAKLHPIHRAAEPQQMLRTKELQRLSLVAFELRRIPGHRAVDRTSGHCHRIQEPARFLRERTKPEVQNVLEGDQPVSGTPLRLHGLSVSHELLDEERTSGRLPDDRLEVGFLYAVMGSDEGVGEPTALGYRERTYPQLDVGVFPRQLDQRPKEGRRLDLLARERYDQEEAKLADRREELVQEPDAVFVPPLKVIDIDDERLDRRHAAEQLSKSEEGASPHLHGLPDVTRGRRELRDHGHPLQNRKDRTEQLDVLGEQIPHPFFGQRAEKSAQVVDDGVHALVRKVLTLVAEPLQHQRRALLELRVQEPPEQRRFADPRGSMDTNEHRLSQERSLIRLAEPIELLFTADHQCARCGCRYSRLRLGPKAF